MHFGDLLRKIQRTPTKWQFQCHRTINISKPKKNLNPRHVYENCLFALTHFATHSRERKSSCCCVCTHHVRYGDWHSCYTHTHRRLVIGEIRSKRSFDCRQDSKCHGRLCISLFQPVSTGFDIVGTGFWNDGDFTFTSL